VEEKKRKMQEAIARGQLDIGDSGRPNKRRNVDHGNSSNLNHKNDRGQNRNRATNRGQGARLATEQRIPDSGWPRKTQAKESSPNPEPISVRPSVASDPDAESDEDDDQPEAISSKVVPYIEQALSVNHADTGVPAEEMSPPKVAPVDKTTRKKAPLQPKLPPKNPFASRPTLLRNVI